MDLMAWLGLSTVSAAEFRICGEEPIILRECNRAFMFCVRTFRGLSPSPSHFYSIADESITHLLLWPLLVRKIQNKCRRHCGGEKERFLTFSGPMVEFFV